MRGNFLIVLRQPRKLGGVPIYRTRGNKGDMICFGWEGLATNPSILGAAFSFWKIQIFWMENLGKLNLVNGPSINGGPRSISKNHEKSLLLFGVSDGNIYPLDWVHWPGMGIPSWPMCFSGGLNLDRSAKCEIQRNVGGMLFSHRAEGYWEAGF